MGLNKSKFITLSLLFTAIFFSFTSCEKDDDNDSTQQENENVDETAAQGVSVSGKIGSYTYVDLGLPSGTKWATYNVGASKPSEYGDYFAWGETNSKKMYDETTYKWGPDSTQSKYWLSSANGTIGTLTTLLAEDDAATANWGTGWRMPTYTEQQELIDGCDWKNTDDFNGSGVAGRIGTSKTNGNTIFLPDVGHNVSSGIYSVNEDGGYWSASLYGEQSNFAYCIYFFKNEDVDWDTYSIESGLCVRAVSK